MSAEEKPPKDKSKLWGGHSFQKGKSGNPGGRPKNIRNLARELTKNGEDIIRFYKAVMDDQLKNRLGKFVSSPVALRLQAADRLADRGFGKPVQNININESDIDEAIEEELRIQAEMRANAQTAVVGKPQVH